MPQEDNFRRMMILIDIPFPNCCSLSLLLHLFVLPLLGNARARNTLMLCALGNIIILPLEINSRTMAFEYLKLQRVLIRYKKIFLDGDNCTIIKLSYLEIIIIPYTILFPMLQRIMLFILFKIFPGYFKMSSCFIISIVIKCNKHRMLICNC